MSSGIKLRFWCNEHQYVEAGFGGPIDAVYFNQHDELGVPCPLCHKSRPMTIERWAGQEDKNGTPIYQGDILQEYDRHGKLDRAYPLVYYKNGLYLDDYLFSNWNAEDVEVIGNIHQNPDLLTPTPSQEGVINTKQEISK